MSKEAASADLQAAAYWRNVARADRSEDQCCGDESLCSETAARREEKEPTRAASRAGVECGLTIAAARAGDCQARGRVAITS